MKQNFTRSQYNQGMIWMGIIQVRLADASTTTEQPTIYARRYMPCKLRSYNQ